MLKARKILLWVLISWLTNIFLTSFLPTLAYLTNALHILSLVFCALAFCSVGRPAHSDAAYQNLITWSIQDGSTFVCLQTKPCAFRVFLDQPAGTPIEDQKCAVLLTMKNLAVIFHVLLSSFGLLREYFMFYCILLVWKSRDQIKISTKLATFWSRGKHSFQIVEISAYEQW